MSTLVVCFSNFTSAPKKKKTHKLLSKLKPIHLTQVQAVLV